MENIKVEENVNISDCTQDMTKLNLTDTELMKSENYRTGVVFDERMVDHYCLWDADYPECPERFSSPLKRCYEYGLIDRCLRIPSRCANEEEILQIHSAALLDLIKMSQDLTEDNLKTVAAQYDSIFFHPKTYECALLAVGSVLNLVSAILDGQVQNGMAIIRPPGHHATFDDPCGYCYFNNVAIAAKHALTHYGLQRILIVDWDVHHGQATQYFYYDDPHVLYFSIHRYENGTFWPNLRESHCDYIGKDDGMGYNINVPLNQTKMTNGDYLSIFFNVLLPVAYEYSPELIIISSGFDAALGCPEGMMEVMPQAYPHMLNLLSSLAGGRICVVLEGGYCISSLTEGVALCLRGLLGDPCPDIGPTTEPCDSIVETILNIICILRPFWHSLRLQSSYNVNEEDKSLNDYDHDMTSQKKKRHKAKISYDYVADKQSTEIMYSKSETEILDKRIQLLRENTDLSVPPNRTCVAFDTRMTQHKNSMDKSHPEKPERITWIYAKLQQHGLVNKSVVLEPRYATDEELALVHNLTYIEKVKLVESMKSKDISKAEWDYQSVYLSKGTYRSASLAVGSLLQTIDAVLTRKCQNGMAIIRPPGHHAEKDEACGFCIFNSVAIGAKYALNNYNVKRILILDWDIHHGNGIQNIFYDDPRVLYISLHRYDHGLFFPCSPNACHDAVGENEGKGFNINIPWNKGNMGDGDYLSAFFHIILPVAYMYNPELVLVSAGFDAAKGDPLGGCKVSPKCFGHMTHLLSGLANGKIILALEGGYNLQVISDSVFQCTQVLLGGSCENFSIGLCPSSSAVTSIQNVINATQNYWKCLKYNYELASFIPQVLALDVKKITADDSPTYSPNDSSSPERSSPVPILDCPKANSTSKPKETEPKSEILEAAGGTEKNDNPVLFCVTPLTWCPHLELLQSLPLEGLDVGAPCESCGDRSENWVCLHCYQVYCSRYVNQHMMQHSNEFGHSLSISFSDISVWCYGCDSYVDNEVLHSAINEIRRKKFG